MNLNLTADHNFEFSKIMLFIIIQCIGHLFRRIDYILLGGLGLMGSDNFSHDLGTYGFNTLNPPFTLAYRTVAAKYVPETLPGTFTRHFHQTEGGEPVDTGLGTIMTQSILQRCQHTVAVLLALHIDEVNNNDPAEITQSKLSCNSSGRLYIGVEDCLL